MRAEIETQLLAFEKEHKFGDESIKRWRELDIKIDPKEVADVIDWMIGRRFIWRWLALISLLIVDVENEDKLTDLIISIAELVKGDMAGGPFINSLIHLGKTRPALALKVYTQLTRKRIDLARFSGLILGGVSTTDPSVLDYLIKNLTSSKNGICVSYLRAVRVSINETKIDGTIFPVLDILKKSDDLEIQLEVLHAYFDFYLFNKEEVMKQIVEFSRRDNIIIKKFVAERLIYPKIDNEDTRILISILSDNSDTELMNELVTALVIKCKTNTEFCLSILEKWLVSQVYYRIDNVNWLLEEVGKENLDLTLQILKTWLGKHYLPMFSGSVFWAAGKHDPDKTIDALISTLYNKNQRNYALLEIRHILDKLYEENKDGSNNIVDKCFDNLCKLSISEGYDPIKTSKPVQNKIFKCCAIMDELVDPKNPLLFNDIFSNLKKYPYVESFLTLKWFNEKQRKNEDHPLLRLLSKDDFSGTNQAYLEYLNQLLSTLNYDEAGMGGLKNKLRENGQFWETFSELDIIWKLKQRYPVVIEPKVDLIQDGKPIQSRPDLEIILDSNPVLIEIINPQMFAELHYFHVAGIPERLDDKIYTEFKEHFKGMVLKKYVVIAVDYSRSEIRYDSAEDYMEGSSQVTLEKNTQTGNIVGVYATRADDSMIKRDPDTKIIIGLLLYQKIIGDDGKIHLRGRVFPNSTVINKDQGIILDILKEVVLG
jgi:hypothetical protein